MHDVNVGRPERRVTERARHRADDRETVALPELHGGRVRGDDEVELHRGETGAARFVHRVLAHRRGDALAACVGGDHVAAVGDVIAEARLVRRQQIAADARGRRARRRSVRLGGVVHKACASSKRMSGG